MEISKKDLIQNWLNNPKKLKENVQEITKGELEEAKKKKKKKDDRCTRIAKSKYDVWPSAYASGAVVKCRRGKIWKGLNEEGNIGGQRNLDVGREQNKNVDITNLKKQINNGLGKDMWVSYNELLELAKLEFNAFPKADIDKSDIIKPIILLRKRGVPYMSITDALADANKKGMGGKWNSLSNYYEIIDGRHRIIKAINEGKGLNAVVITESEYENATNTKRYSKEVEEILDEIGVSTIEKGIDFLKKYKSKKAIEALKFLTKEKILRDSNDSINESLEEKWSQKYKRSIDCNNPKGFSQKAHCQGRLKENAKSGTPEELIDLLKLLPIDETAKELTNQIMSDLKDYYQNNGELPSIKTYAYQPEDKCIQPYELEVDFIQKKGAAVVGVGYAEQHYIQLYILQKDVEAAYHRVLSLPDKIVNIIKHECSHHYLSQKNIESCLYHTHPDGMKKYYYDRQELVLHSREIFDEFDKKVSNWRNQPLDKIRVYIADKVKDLRDYTRINQPFPQSLRNKYVAFIMNNYIKPNHNSINKSLNEKTDFSKEKYTKPNFELEWQEAERYPEFVEMGKEGWMDIAKKGYVVKYSKIKNILGNVDLNFDNLDSNKKKRFQQAFKLGKIELPIVVKFSDSKYDLVAGNTRLSGLIKNGIDPLVWVVDISEMLNEKTDFSKEKSKGLHGWFERQGGSGKSKGWVDCNTCRTVDGKKKCKTCGRQEGEKRAKYPACRPTPSACGSKGKGKSWGKKSANEDVLNESVKTLTKQDIERELKLNEIKSLFQRHIGKL